MNANRPEEMRLASVVSNASSGAIYRMPIAMQRGEMRDRTVRLMRLAFPDMSIRNVAAHLEVESGVISARTWERVAGRQRDPVAYEIMVVARHAAQRGVHPQIIAWHMGADGWPPANARRKA